MKLSQSKFHSMICSISYEVQLIYRRVYNQSCRCRVKKDVRKCDLKIFRSPLIAIILFHPKGRRGRKFVGMESLIALLVLVRLEISSTIQRRNDLGEERWCLRPRCMITALNRVSLQWLARLRVLQHEVTFWTGQRVRIPTPDGKL